MSDQRDLAILAACTQRDEWRVRAETAEAAVVRLTAERRKAEGVVLAITAWTDEDKPLPEDREIDEAFPTRSGFHDLYAEAMRLVGARRSKSALVELVNWLLVKVHKAEKKCEAAEEKCDVHRRCHIGGSCSAGSFDGGNDRKEVDRG